MDSNANHLFLGNYGDRAVCLEKGQGVYVQDTTGKKYLDLSAGVAVSSLGYSHPVLVNSLKRQADKLWHSSNLWHNSAAIRLAQELTSRTFADRVFLCNSGLEANEAALKLALKRGNEIATTKNRILCFSDAFHGRSLFTLSLGGKKMHRSPYEPLPQNIIRVQFNDPDALVQAMDKNICAIIVEPIQGEGGVNPARSELLQAARKLCDKHNALLIFDEIQTGMGRSGHLFSYIKHNITPDLLSLAKGLGSGFPIGALLANKKAADHSTPGSHGSTFGGNALAAAVATEVIKIVDDADFLAAIRFKGKLLKEGLEKINKELECFTEIRGEGLLWGAQLDDKYKGIDIKEKCREDGLLILLAGEGDVLRFAPPLVIDEDSINLGLNKLYNLLRKIKK